MKHFIPYFFLILFCIQGKVAKTQEITFASDIASIIYNNCTTCHRPGEIAPSAFTSYDEIKNWGGTIKYVTQSKYMPPWPPNKEYAHLIGERGLTDEEIQHIATWVDNGMPQGDMSLAPELPIFPTGSQVGEPDLVLTMKEAFVQPGNNTDTYRVFVLPTGLTEDKQVATMELRPGNAKVVHHALFSYDTTGEAQALDNQDPNYGYDGFGGFGIDAASSTQFPGYVPGQKPYIYPSGLGKLLPANSDLLVQMHYAPVPVAESDQSTINIFFKEETVERQVREFIMLPFGFSGTELDQPFFIPANTERTFHGTFTTPIDVSILAIAPHMHLLGQHWEVYMEAPDGTITNLIEIPTWDFNWQGTYNFPKYMVAKAGTTIHAIASYDNTTNNPQNPNNPPQFVTWGEKTTDEMYYLPISYVPYQTGDEDVIFEDSTTSTQEQVSIELGEDRLFDPFPNPTSTELNVHFTLAMAQRVVLSLQDINGRTLATEANNKVHYRGRHEYTFDVMQIPSGTYSVTLTTDRGVVQTKQVKIN